MTPTLPPESDRPAEGWFGHKDPATVAINHVRSDALIALINYSAHLAQIEPRREQQSSAGRRLAKPFRRERGGGDYTKVEPGGGA